MICAPTLVDGLPSRSQHHRIVRLNPAEATSLNSAEKVPYLLMLEVLTEDFDFDPRKLLRRRSSMVVADLPIREFKKGEDKEALKEERDDEEEKEEKEEEKPKKKPPPAQFNEPDANSLLDAFGF